MAEEKRIELNDVPKELRVFHEENGVLMGILSDESELFRSTLAMLKDGKATVELKKRYMLRAIDEQWVNAIEEALPALDAAIRKPGKYIEEREEILPIELSKKVSPASVKHLAQHTDLIKKVEGDKVTPSKLLNVFREETMQTYENKFLNTLIRNLMTFVSLRYEVASKEGKDEKDTTLTFEQNFTHGNVNGKMHFTLEISEPTDEDDVVEKNYTKTTDLWKRVEKIRDIVQTYAGSEFVRNMGNSYVRPPIMRTNALLKNPNLRICLNLYGFIEGYEAAGYSMLVQEDLEQVPESYIREVYSTFAAQYLNFRYHVRNEFNEEDVLDSQLGDEAFMPQIVDRLKKLSREEFDVILGADEQTADEAESFEPGELTTAVEVALRASEMMLSANPEESLARGEIPEPEPVPEYVEEEEKPEEGKEAEGSADSEASAGSEEPSGENSEAAEEQKPRRKGENRDELVGEKLGGKMRRNENRKRKRYVQHQRNRGVSYEEIRKKLGDTVPDAENKS